MAGLFHNKKREAGNVSANIGKFMAEEIAWNIDQAGYNELLTLPNSGWGWEFKRRDPVFRKQALVARCRGPIVLRRDDGAMLLRLRRRQLDAEEHGLQFFPNPNDSALVTYPFWLPEMLVSDLDASVEEDRGEQQNERSLRWDRLPGRKIFLYGPGRRPKLMISKERFVAQLAIEEGNLPILSKLHISIKVGSRHLINNGRCLNSFIHFCNGTPLSDSSLRGYRPEKLRNALIALDGHIAGASRRNIAELIFGMDVVKSSWNDGNDLYKKRTKRLVEKGLYLMNEGYKKLL